MIGVEAGLPMADVRRAVARMKRRCTRSGDCLLHRPVKQSVPQLRCGGVVLSAIRAVLMVARGRPVLETHEVMRTCDQKLCVEPTHLVAKRRGDLLPAARERYLEANAESSAQRRTWDVRKVALLRRAVDSGMSVNRAAEIVGFGRQLAHAIIQGRRGPDSGATRSEGRGTVGNPMCSRCGGLGHFRDRGCPSQPDIEGGRQ